MIAQIPNLYFKDRGKQQEKNKYIMDGSSQY